MNQMLLKNIIDYDLLWLMHFVYSVNFSHKVYELINMNLNESQDLIYSY